jgi:hypothetical protein
MSTGFKDPDGAFPRPEYIGQATTNKAARDEWTPKIVLPDGVAGTDLVKMDWQPEYPYNKVEETSSGHRVEHDDTLGNERLSYVHKDGSGIEMYPNAEEQTTVLVNSVGRMVQLVGDDFVMIVNGNGDVTYKGNLNLNVEGDFNVSCNNYTITTKGKNIEETKQQKIENFVGDRVVTTQGNKSEIVLGNYTVESMGNTYLVSKENTRITAQDNIDIFAGDDMRLTADGRMTSSALINRVVGICTSVVGNTGTFGGANISMYSKDFNTGEVKATKVQATSGFKGDLDGNISGHSKTTDLAKDIHVDAQSISGTFGSLAAPVTVTAAGTAQPNLANLTEGLARTVQLAIRQIDVDDTSIGNSVHGGSETGGSSGQSGNIPPGFGNEFDNQQAPPGELSAAQKQAIEAANPGQLAEIEAAIKESAKQMGVEPSALAAMVQTESTFKSNLSYGSYYGATQMGEATFTEAGGTLNGLTYEQYKNASLATQIRTYPAWANHYNWNSKLGGVIGQYNAATQAAVMQAFQFGPNAVKTWQTPFKNGDYSKASTPHKQASFLGNTSINDMANYYSGKV